MLTGRGDIEDGSSLCSVLLRTELEEKVRMAFAAPISFFKTISIIFGGAGLIFEGSTSRSGCGNETFCQGLPGGNPQGAVAQILTDGGGMAPGKSFPRPQYSP